MSVSKIETEIFIDQKLKEQKKSTFIAYCLFFVLGLFGIHNYYVNRSRLASIELGLFLALMVCLLFQVDPDTVPHHEWVAILWVYDLFSLKSAIKRDTEVKRKKIIEELTSETGEKKEESNTTIKNIGINAGIVLIIVVIAMFYCGHSRVSKQADQMMLEETVSEMPDKSVDEARQNENIRQNENSEDNNSNYSRRGDESKAEKEVLQKKLF